MQRGLRRPGKTRCGKAEGGEAQDFYKFVLDNYVSGGVEVFTREDALSQLIVTKYRTINDAKTRLGELGAIRDGFATLQKKVYAA